MRPVLIGAAAILAAGAWAYYQQAQDQATAEADGTDTGTTDGWLSTADQVLTDTASSAADFLDYATGGILKISNMRNVSPAMLGNQNVQALLRVIRTGEGTNDANGYRRIFGGQLFDSYKDHPRITVSRSGYTSTAAGAYQALASSWDETARIMGLKDFSPASQDLFALGRIAARGALEDALAGRLASALKKINREWASLPGSPYGQPTISQEEARRVFLAAGGIDSGTVYA